ncbi:hypothetical protein ISS85_04045 [Candidatus Microgenomates bacterium]|nr:hypothetical protein [Candidatus Microgenomates bacterium]
MGNISSKRKSFLIKQKHQRKTKLKKLREKYVGTKSSFEKDKVWEKAHKISPLLSKEEFLKPIKE